MNARRRFWAGFSAGALAAALAGGCWLWWITGSNRPHKHVYGRWREAATMASRSGSWPINERRCLRCGWRDWRLASPGLTEQH